MPKFSHKLTGRQSEAESPGLEGPKSEGNQISDVFISLKPIAVRPGLGSVTSQTYQSVQGMSPSLPALPLAQLASA